MKLYKKIALVLLSVILAVSAAACDDGNTPVVGGKEELKGNIVLALPLAWALSAAENAASIVWISLPVAEAGACVVAVLLTRRTYRRRI